MTWRYRAADANGREAEGVLDADTAADALTQLRQRALWVIELAPAHDDRGSAVPATSPAPATARPWRDALSNTWTRWSGRDLDTLAVRTRAVATLLAAGVPLERTLAHAATAGEADDADAGGWRGTFTRVRDAVRGGSALSDALAREPRFPAAFAPSVAAAEAAGTLAITFDALAASLERTAQVQARVRSALVYPVVLATSSIVGTLVILIGVVPRFAALVTDTGGQLPLSTRLLVGAGAFMTKGGWLLLPALAAAVLWWRRSLRAPEARLAWDTQRLTWPVFGAFERQRDAARYLGTLALALGAGVPLLRAMALARATVHNRALAARFEPAEARVRDGAALGSALGDVLPPLAVQLLSAGEAGAALAPLAQRAAQAADEAAEQQLARVVALIEPVMILGFGGLVAFVALALLQAIYGLNAGLG